MTNNIEIRKMEEEDIDGVLSIERMSFTTPWSKEAFEMEIKKNKLAIYLVAVKEEKIVGYGGMWFIVDEAHVTNVAVDPSYRGLGISNFIVEEMIKGCIEKKIERMTLEVRSSNIVAQNLYKKYGFESCGIRPGYYTDTNEDAVIMWKKV